MSVAKVVSVEEITLSELNVHTINSISDKYPEIRQKSKSPTFLLTYKGTWMGLMQNCGFTEEESKSIEHRYHELYVESDAWVEAKIKQAHDDGYVTGAFGLRVRTPLLKATLYNQPKMPYQAKAEGRTAGNALGQSWCLLNNRAAIEFQERVINSQYRLDIRPSAAIHDANYMLIRNDVELVKWVNDNLVECAEWQDHPDIQHDEVGLGGELSIFYPSWKEEYVLPNKATVQEIISICVEK